MGHSRAIRWMVAIAAGMLSVLVTFDAAGTYVMTGEGRIGSITKDFDYRFDPSGALDIHQVLQSEEGWATWTGQGFPTERSPITAWVRLKLPPMADQKTVLLLTVPWEQLDCYVIADGKVKTTQRAGSLLPQGERSSRISLLSPALGSGFVEIELSPAGPTTVYVRLATMHRLVQVKQLGFRILDAERVQAAERRDRLIQGVLMGVMLFVLAYNLGIYLFTRELSYLWYVLMEGGYCLAWWTVFGLSFELFWPDHPAWDFPALWLATIVGGTGMYQFLRFYLDVRRFSPRLDAALKIVSWVNLLIVPLMFSGMDYASLMEFLINASPLGVILFVVVVHRAYRAQHPLATNLLLAASCWSMGILIFVGASLQWLPTSEFTIHAPQLGSMLFAIILSWGLGMRLERARNELATTQLAHEQEKRALAEEQARELESRVAMRTSELAEANRQSDALLANILPGAVITELRATGESEPRRHDEVSILFTDFSGFTQTVSTLPPKRLVQELNEIFRAFDDIVVAHGLEKIKTIGDAYMAAGGLPTPVGDHAQRCVRAGLAMTRFIEARNRDAALKWGLRVGVHSGTVVAGVVGKVKYAYDVWGDTVNIASRLESSGETGRVNVSAYTYELVRDSFECEYRGKIAAKGKGDIDMYFVVRENSPPEQTAATAIAMRAEPTTEPSGPTR